MINIATSIKAGLLGAVVLVGSWFGLVPQSEITVLDARLAQLESQVEQSNLAQDALILGAYNTTGGGTYRLKNSIGLTDTTINLSSFKEPVSNIPYTMTYLNTSIMFATIEPQTTHSEFVSFTGITQNSDGSATLTGVSRGLTRTPAGSACTASTTLAQRHSGQSGFIISDSPCHFANYAVKSNDETITGHWSGLTPTASDHFATRGYVDGVAFGGVGAASETATGTVELATQLEAASSTSSGTLGRLVLPASIATSTWQPATAPLRVVVTQNSGKIDDNFISTSTLFSRVTFATTTATTTNVGSFPIYNIGKNMLVVTTIGTSSIAVPQGVAKLFARLCGGGAGGEGGTSATAGIASSISTSMGGYIYATGGGTNGSQGGTGINGDLNTLGGTGSISSVANVNGLGGASFFGGGGSPGAYCAGGNGVSAKAGGSAGGYAEKMLDVSATSSVTVFVGSGGSAGSGGANGSQGIVIFIW